MSEDNDKEVTEVKLCKSLPSDFNAATYISLYDDLQEKVTDLSQEERKTFAQHHYINWAKIEGRIYRLPDDFEAEIYISLYPDLQQMAEDKSDEEKESFARSHYVKWGKRGGRMYKLPEEFNPETYLSLHPELEKPIKNKTNVEKEIWARQHFANNGCFEGRFCLPEDFCEPIYWSLYPDIRPNNEEVDYQKICSLARKHYAHIGRKEERIYRLPDGFDAKTYLMLLPDDQLVGVKELNSEQKIDWARRHYAFKGMQEGREYKFCFPVDFEAKTYLSLLPDNQLVGIKELNPEQAIEWARRHYVHHGMKEGKIYKLPYDFNGEIYLSLNPALCEEISTEIPEERIQLACKHYANHGRHEGLIYFPSDFNAERYLSINPILDDLAKSATSEGREKFARINYALSGCKMGRVYSLPEVIDAETYIRLNQIQYGDFKILLDREYRSLSEKILYPQQEAKDLGTFLHLRGGDLRPKYTRRPSTHQRKIDEKEICENVEKK